MRSNTVDRILAGRIVAILRDIPAASLEQLAQALIKGGITCMEITFDQSRPESMDDTLEGIGILSALGEQVCVGAGTVMCRQQVLLAARAGAEYMVSPHADPEVIRLTKTLGKVSIPGAMTPTEIVSAYQQGADMVKLFPAGALGAEYFKAVKAPLRHIPIMAMAGITPENCARFIAAGAAGVGVSSNLVNPVWVREGRFEQITALAKEYVQAINKV